MESIEAVLKQAGWSNDIIKTFIRPDIDVVSPISLSAYVVDTFAEQFNDYDLPQISDFTTFSLK